ADGPQARPRIAGRRVRCRHDLARRRRRPRSLLRRRPVFPATLNVDDPCVADELSLPTVSVFKYGDDPSAPKVDISVRRSTRITESFGISIGETGTNLKPPGGPAASGFQNLETTFKYQFLRDATHELGMSAGVSVEWGRTGAEQVGAERFSVITPTLFFGKGFGDLPDTVKWIRPVALTGQVGYAIPDGDRARYRRDLGHAQSAVPGVWRDAAVQHALSEI